MKFIYIIILLFIGLYNDIKAQAYIPTLVDSLWWDVEIGSIGSLPSNTHRGIRFSIGSDTIINNKLYNKVYANALTYTNSTSNVLNNKNTVGFLREDTLTKKLYKISISDTTEYLIIDYNLNLGDTFTITDYESYANGEKLKVDSIDNITTLDGITRRITYLSHCSFHNFSTQDFYYIIEGLGATQGLFNPFAMEFENWEYLLCIKRINGFTVFHPKMVYPGFMEDCTFGFPLFIKEYKGNKDLSKVIYPNPTTGKIKIIDQGIKSLKVYNSSGNLIFNKSIENEYSSLDFSDKAKGLYLLEATYKSGEKLNLRLIVN